MRTKLINISDLKLAQYNPRQMSEHDMASLVKSIRKFGFVEPVVVNRRYNRVIGGHQRIIAAKQLSIKAVPVVYVSLNSKEEKTLNLALNRIHGDWDMEKLSVVLEELKMDDGDDLSLTGFSEIEIGEILDSQTDNGSEDNFDAESEASKIKKPKSKRGEVYQLGRHRLMCGDATVKKDVEKLMDGKKADMVFTDPPYRLSGKGFGYKGDRQYGKLRSDEIFDYKDWLENVQTVAKKDFNILVFEFWKNAVPLWQSLEKYYEIKNMIIWHATNRYTFPHKFFSSRYDICLYAVRGNYYFDLPRDKGSNPPYDVIASPPETEKTSGQSEVFGAKPIGILTPYIKPLCPRNGIILDSFGGSGTTLIACEKTGRVCYMMEIDPVYCDVIQKRYKEYVGENKRKTA